MIRSLVRSHESAEPTGEGHWCEAPGGQKRLWDFCTNDFRTVPLLWERHIVEGEVAQPKMKYLSVQCQFGALSRIGRIVKVRGSCDKPFWIKVLVNRFFQLFIQTF